MAFQLIINVILACLWMFLESSFTFGTFIIGFVIGIVLLFFMRRFLGSTFYLFRLFALIKLLYNFLHDLVVSTVHVSRIVLKKDMNIRPGIFRYDTLLETDWEVTMLALMITLTPGTLSIDISDDYKSIYVHSLHVPNIEEEIATIRKSYEGAIMEVFHG
ncbi:Na+ H+ antiporter subunit E [Listeria fleischmannii 1991]|jgi:multicomponent Na+:H+ antiporter subunit E|uniref:Multiple resistance and pH homeostasis protein E n=4 Tax=Listeria fleischmannii TaxID=1069827 RepID=A0A2X3G6E0_9LIST|nr:Na+/H+ antiporter subunit E [Listeria fleischmannii]EIA20328.1 putative monovalent cation/H+ antiporter subunit E [Listeria fleischmannii subsp. coloradonensis]EUJ62855.1 monovalent cation/H+ antiporter subunit E [Listeria fleischmannii FSL S10-1203]KMT61332.1 Na+ H+ antiporter subunit E [Listeria fleischmannii 1991]MBC1398596.1 Na+/H+ antiporter subunit E [Listeria fleischmannii]MBC1419964.1 Na+/H+ antiporter subunit E [Listeria fleischmannii]